jgi:nitric oxide reductase activation protein
VEAKTRILITLSDGKPDDYSDEYRSEHGIEDTRRTLIDAKRSGIHPFCITIDREGQDYLPHMYGGGELYHRRCGGEAALQGLRNLSATDSLMRA